MSQSHSLVLLVTDIIVLILICIIRFVLRIGIRLIHSLSIRLVLATVKGFLLLLVIDLHDMCVLVVLCVFGLCVPLFVVCLLICVPDIYHSLCTSMRPTLIHRDRPIDIRAITRGRNNIIVDSRIRNCMFGRVMRVRITCIIRGVAHICM